MSYLRLLVFYGLLEPLATNGSQEYVSHINFNEPWIEKK